MKGILKYSWFVTILMEEVPQSERERAKEVFSLIEEKKPQMSREDKKVFSLRLNMFILIIIFLLIIGLLFILRG